MTGAASSAMGPDVTTQGVPEEPTGAGHDRGQDRPATPADTLSTIYRPGPISWLMGRLDPLPGRGWWVVALFALALVTWGNGILWATGQLSAGSIDTNVIILSAYGPYALALSAEVVDRDALPAQPLGGGLGVLEAAERHVEAGAVVAGAAVNGLAVAV